MEAEEVISSKYHSFITYPSRRRDGNAFIFKLELRILLFINLGNLSRKDCGKDAMPNSIHYTLVKFL